MPWRPERSATAESSRTITVGDDRLEYVLQRSKRRTIGLTVDRRGLRVRAPESASLTEVEAAIVRYRQWINDELTHWQGETRPETIRIVDGLSLPLLGQALTLRLAIGANRWLWNLHPTQPTLTLCLRTPGEARRLLERALQSRARELFGERLAEHAARLGVAPPRLSLSAARTRWGSCSSVSGVRLNWRLLHFPLPIIDYVVAHEVAHLQEMNHSPQFWAVVARLHPNYRDTRAELRRLAATCPDW